MRKGRRGRGRGRGTWSGITKATNEGWRGQRSSRVAGCRVEKTLQGGKCGKTGGEDEVTYCPQREPEEGHKQGRPVPARYAVHQEATLI